MSLRVVALFALTLSSSGVNGFSMPTRSTCSNCKASLPVSSSSSALYMSDMPFPQGSGEDSSFSSSSSSTQLQATDASSSMHGMTMEDMNMNMNMNLADKIRSIDFDVNEVINTSVVVGLVAAAMVKFLTVGDAGTGMHSASSMHSMMTSGMSLQEHAQHIVSLNWEAYLQVLRAHPIATKAFTSATVYAIGDTLAQRTEGQSMASLDRARILRSSLAGGIGHGPMSHVWYQVSEHFFDHVVHLTAWWSFIPKVAVDQSVWGPIWNNSYILLLGMMKMQSPKMIWGDMKRTTVPLILSGLKLWPLAHCVTYGLIPVENRLLWVDMVEILWVTILATQAAGVVAVAGETAVPVEELIVVPVETTFEEPAPALVTTSQR